MRSNCFCLPNFELMKSSAAVLAALFFLVTLSQCADAQDKKPNIVVIMGDDVGM